MASIFKNNTIFYTFLKIEFIFNTKRHSYPVSKIFTTVVLMFGRYNAYSITGSYLSKVLVKRIYTLTTHSEGKIKAELTERDRPPTNLYYHNLSCRINTNHPLSSFSIEIYLKFGSLSFSWILTIQNNFFCEILQFNSPAFYWIGLKCLNETIT